MKPNCEHGIRRSECTAKRCVIQYALRDIQGPERAAKDVRKHITPVPDHVKPLKWRKGRSA